MMREYAEILIQRLQVLPVGGNVNFISRIKTYSRLIETLDMIEMRMTAEDEQFSGFVIAPFSHYIVSAVSEA
jgi:hypothetical protein